MLVRVNEQVKRRTRVVGIFLNGDAITDLVCAVVLEKDEHGHVEGRRIVSADRMAAIPSLKDLPNLQECSD